MMKITEEFKTLALTARLNMLCEESIKIGKIIGDLPIIYFPEQHKKLIELGEEEYELAIQLYGIYLNNGEVDRAAYVLNAQNAIEMSLYALKKDLTLFA